MKRIVGQMLGFKKLAMEVLAWITCAKRQLTTVELQHALATKIGTSGLDAGDLPHIGDIISMCVGLVMVDEESGIIRLVHYTTQEYLEQTLNSWYPGAESRIARICITYLSFSIFEAGYCKTDQAFEERLRSNPLYDYAAHNWGYHTKDMESSQEVVSFLESKPKVEASSQALMADKYGWWRPSSSQKAPEKVTGLHLAAYFGIAYAVDTLLQRKHNPDQEDSDSRTPLSWAIENGHEAAVKLLLDTGKVDVNAEDRSGRTPLWLAAGKGYEAIVKLLLKTHAVDVNAKDIYGRTPLWWAARKGYTAIVKLLLDEREVDVDAKEWHGQTPLSKAAEHGYEAIVKLLLETNKADINAENKLGQTPLWWAACKMHVAIVKLLVDTDKADVNAVLRRAVENGDTAMVKLLLDTGKADINAKDRNGQTPWLWAVDNGHRAIVQLLRDTGKVEFNATLWQALETRDEAIVMQWRKGGQTPLWCAAARIRHEIIVQLLQWPKWNNSSRPHS